MNDLNEILDEVSKLVLLDESEFQFDNDALCDAALIFSTVMACMMFKRYRADEVSSDEIYQMGLSFSEDLHKMITHYANFDTREHLKAKKGL